MRRIDLFNNSSRVPAACRMYFKTNFNEWKKSKKEIHSRIQLPQRSIVTDAIIFNWLPIMFKKYWNHASVKTKTIPHESYCRGMIMGQRWKKRFFLHLSGLHKSALIKKFTIPWHVMQKIVPLINDSSTVYQLKFPHQNVYLKKMINASFLKKSNFFSANFNRDFMTNSKNHDGRTIMNVWTLEYIINFFVII